MKVPCRCVYPNGARAYSVLCTAYRYLDGSHRLFISISITTVIPIIDNLPVPTSKHFPFFYTTNNVADFQRLHFITMETPKSLKRNYQRMMQDQQHSMMNIENVYHHDFQYVQSSLEGPERASKPSTPAMSESYADIHTSILDQAPSTNHHLRHRSRCFLATLFRPQTNM